jgi:hypothetical protein
VQAKNVADIDFIISKNREYYNKTNDATWNGIPAEEAVFRGMTAGEPQFESGVTYYRATARIPFKEPRNGLTKPFNKLLVNRGFGYWKGGIAADDFVIHEDDGEVFSEPILLKVSDGDRLPQGTIGETVEYRTKETADFSDIWTVTP